MFRVRNRPQRQSFADGCLVRRSRAFLRPAGRHRRVNGRNLGPADPAAAGQPGLGNMCRAMGPGNSAGPPTCRKEPGRRAPTGCKSEQASSRRVEPARPSNSGGSEEGRAGGRRRRLQPQQVGSRGRLSLRITGHRAHCR